MLHYTEELDEIAAASLVEEAVEAEEAMSNEEGLVGYTDESQMSAAEEAIPSASDDHMTTVTGDAREEKLPTEKIDEGKYGVGFVSSSAGEVASTDKGVDSEGVVSARRSEKHDVPGSGSAKEEFSSCREVASASADESTVESCGGAGDSGDSGIIATSYLADQVSDIGNVGTAGGDKQSTVVTVEEKMEESRSEELKDMPVVVQAEERECAAGEEEDGDESEKATPPLKKAFTAPP